MEEGETRAYFCKDQFGTIKLPSICIYTMNNAIFATIFVVMVMTTGYVTMAYVWAPSPAVLYEPVQGDDDNSPGMIQDIKRRSR